MISKRKAGMMAHRIARKVYRKSIRKPKRVVAKLYAAKVGKARFNRLTKHSSHRKRKSYRRQKRRTRW